MPDRIPSEVRTIRIKEPVPQQYAELGFLDSWRLMARRSAFDAMLKEIGSEAAFTARFCLKEEWTPGSGSSGCQLSIVCEIEYRLDIPK